MKTYTITVNGNVYDVTVEEGQTSGAAAAPVKAAAPKAAPKAAAPAASGAAGAVKVEAPMQGKILKVNAAVGASVKKGDVVVVLEAMKMENEIFAPQDGTVASVECSVGDTVETGKVLVTMN